PPKCVPVSCGEPELPENSIVSGQDFKYRGNITYICISGYNLQGVAMLTCQANGTWSVPPPKCVPVSCGPPSIPPHVIAEYLIPEIGIKNAFGTSIAFNCEEGYELMGGKFQVCESEGLWVGSAPKCVEHLCGSAPVMKYSTVLIDESVRPQSATYTCQRGYNLIGSDTITCKMGKWTKPSFTCELLNCPEPIVPHMGLITVNSSTFGSIANYSCIFGYTLNGNPSVECGSAALWMGDIPKCLPVDCGTP
ncbi:unnamed protein product, partial [Meganyctiphanes norvegica]